MTISEIDPGLYAGNSVPYEVYHLHHQEMNQLEKSLLDELKASGVEGGVVAVVADSATNLANFGRTQETMTFTEQAGEDYDFHTAMRPYEENSFFLYTVDVDQGVIAHSKRLVAARPEDERLATGLTGIEVFDDRLTATEPAEQCTLEEIQSYHGITDLEGCLHVTTNMATRRAAPTPGKPYALISYKAVFELAQQSAFSHIIAYQNPQAIRSLAKLGVAYQLLTGREYHLPTTAAHTEAYDAHYLALVIPGSEHNTKAFTEFNPAKPLTKLIAGKEVPVYYKLLEQQPPHRI